jgi:hypothetical protein
MVSSMNLPAVTIDESRRVVVLRFEGVVNLATFTQGREAIQKEPGWSPRYAHVFDFTAITDLDLAPKAIQTLASAPPVFDKTSPQVLVARGGSFEFGIARMFSAYATGLRNVHVVDSLEAAHALLATLRW